MNLRYIASCENMFCQACTSGHTHGACVPSAVTITRLDTHGGCVPAAVTIAHLVRVSHLL